MPSGVEPFDGVRSRNGYITDVPGILAGHAQDFKALTGCTVIISPAGAVAGCDVRGSAPGTRETDLLRPGNLVEKAHAVLLAGGSAFGLDAAAGVMRCLEEKGFGFDVGVARVPIVPAAVIFDLAVGDPHRRPDADMGKEACETAFSSTGSPASRGNVGAGTGATVGKTLGMAGAMKGGLGSSSIRLADGTTVGAMVVVNALGDVIDPETQRVIAGARKEGGGFLNAPVFMLGLSGHAQYREAAPFHAGCNTTIGVIATDAALDKAAANKIAQMAHDGLARTINPVHTMHDGDTVFCLSTGRKNVDVTLLGTAAAFVMERAVIDAVLHAESIGGIPSAKDVLE